MSRLGTRALHTFALLAALSTAAAAQSGTVAGRVTAAGAPLADVKVQVMDVNRKVASAQSGPDGAYSIPFVNPGAYDVVAYKLGYAPSRTKNQLVSAGSTTTVNIAMAPAATRLDAVVTTSQRGRSEKVLETDAVINVVGEEQLRRNVAVTLAGHVQGMAGVDVNQGGVAQSNIVARGFNNAFSGSMLMMQDYRFAGVPSLRVNIPLLFTGTNEDIERVEVLLGPASALFGPNSANGVLHVISKSPFTSQGTTVTVDGGERSLLRGSIRTAQTFGEKVGVKLSGEMMRAEDFEYEDPGEPDSLTRAGTRVLNQRDFHVERASGEARLDVRPREGMELITTVGATQIGSGLELTSANGTAQIKNWRFLSLQQRLSWNRFFLQGFINSSNAGNTDSADTRGTFLLRTGQPIVDQSQVYSVQAQHALDVGQRLKFTYGADYIYTNPSTGRTINGRNEDIDDMQEFGVYLQNSAQLTSRVDLMTAVRADQHKLIDGTFFSPRVAILFKPVENQSLRATFNRAFNTPQNFSFFLDLLAARNPGGLPINVRAMGNPPKDGWQFNRSCTGFVGSFCMRSAFVPASTAAGGAMIPAAAGLGLPGLMTGQRTSLIAGISAALQAGGVPPANANALATGIVDDLRTPRPELANIATTLRYLGSATDLDPASVVDLEPLKASYNNTYELGYKGTMGRKVTFDLASWYQSRGDIAAPASFATPGAHMVPGSAAAYMQPRIQAILQGAGFPAAQASATATAIANNLSNTFAPVPMGTVTFDDPRLAPNADVIATYRRVDKQVDVWGTDVSADYQFTDAVTLTGTFGYANKVVFEDVIDQRNAPFTLNAPGYKGSLTARYTSLALGWGGEVRGRYLDGFPVNSGVYSSYGTFVSPNPGGAAYSYNEVPTNTLLDVGVNYRFLFNNRNALWSLSVSNALNSRKPSFAGVPDIGRMAMTRLQYTF
jgi:outer membrane receptor for ferrienterochelin and colicins